MVIYQVKILYKNTLLVRNYVSLKFLKCKLHQQIWHVITYKPQINSHPRFFDTTNDLFVVYLNHCETQQRIQKVLGLLAKFSPSSPIVIAWFLERTFAKPSNFII
jgi:hypothetical protein